MKVKRIVTNIAAPDIAAAKRFYGDVLGLACIMDLGWIATYGSRQTMSVQVSVATEDGSGTDVPDLSIEVDDVDAALHLFKKAGIAIAYDPADEPFSGELRGSKTAQIRRPGQRVRAPSMVVHQ